MKQPKSQPREKVGVQVRENTSLLHPMPLEHQDLCHLERATEPRNNTRVRLPNEALGYSELEANWRCSYKEERGGDTEHNRSHWK